jgi:DNA modification methylase
MNELKKGITVEQKEISLKILGENNLSLEKKFSKKLFVNSDLTRSLVSFQANKSTPIYRWYKFKEGYSYALVDYILHKLNVTSGKLIDPFAGSGTSLFASNEHGMDSVGIELLPIGVEIIKVRKIILDENKEKLVKFLKSWCKNKPWLKEKNGKKLSHLNITKGAFPKETELLIGKYLQAIEKEKKKEYRRILRFALLCILEEVSFTRKDGQYLRWDYRSGRSVGRNTFNKGVIKEFNEAIIEKLRQFIEDIGYSKLTPNSTKCGNMTIMQDSALSILPKLKSQYFDILITSPPYCNRYDYTRTYAVELALLGVGEEKLKELRQEMVSCTVENKDKENMASLFSKDTFHLATKAFEEQKELQDILSYLEDKRVNRKLNNPGIPRMVKNYFYELTLCIFECSKLLKKSAPFVMVNDNVRYAGANIPVDLILSDIAQKAGFEIENIWVLPKGKGNSSQQMGMHGREEQRKCVYVWRKL